MTISKYTDNLYQSEVYRELERQAVKKGFFKPTESELVKMAAQEAQHIDDSSSSDDLVQDIARLAFAMRRKGFITQAEDIEQKLVMFKRAENAFYNVIDEKNSDLIDFAHRDGDVNLIPGSGDLGAFETMQSISDKIQAVIRKQPTGKQGMAELAAMINKVGQAGGAPATMPSMGGASAGGAPAQGGMAVSEAVPQPKTRREILDTIGETLNKFDTVRRQIQNIPGITTFGFDNIDSPGQESAYIYFAGLAGRQINPNDINALFRAKEAAEKEGVFVNGLVDSNAMYNKLSSHGGNFLLSIANVLGVGAVFQRTYLDENSPKYIWSVGVFSTSPSQYALEACQWLQQTFQNLSNRVLGANNEIFNGAKSNMVGMVENLIKELNTINIERGGTANEGVRQLVKVNQGIENALATFIRGESFRYITLVNPEVNSIVPLLKSVQQDISNKYQSLLGSEGLKYVDINPSILDEAIGYWERQTESDNEGIANKAASIADKIGRVQEIIRKYNKRPWIELQEALSEMNPPIDAPNKSVFLAGLEKIVESAKGRK